MCDVALEMILSGWMKGFPDQGLGLSVAVVVGAFLCCRLVGVDGKMALGVGGK